MAPARQIYLQELARIQERINALFEQVLVSSAGYEGSSSQHAPGTWSPAVDLVETDEAYLLHAELPGVERENVDLKVLDGRLELSGRRRLPAGSRNFLRMERTYGPFRRIFELGSPVAEEAVEAAFHRGVLRVILPKLRRGGAPRPDPVAAEE